MSAEEQKRWELLLAEYRLLNHVPRIRAAVLKKYGLLECNGMARCDALEQAMIEHAYKEDTRPTVMVDGAAEYEMIIQGGQIWADIQKSSGR